MATVTGNITGTGSSTPFTATTDGNVHWWIGGSWAGCTVAVEVSQDGGDTWAFLCEYGPVSTIMRPASFDDRNGASAGKQYRLTSSRFGSGCIQWAFWQ